MSNVIQRISPSVQSFIALSRLPVILTSFVFENGCATCRSDGTILGPQGRCLEYAATYFLAPGRNTATTLRIAFTPPSPSRLALEDTTKSLTAQTRTEPLTRR